MRGCGAGEAATAVAIVVTLVVFALAWALPEDHTLDRLYRPVVEQPHGLAA